MWKPEHRVATDRRGRRYPSDLTDAEWELIEPLIPRAKGGGRKHSVYAREELSRCNAIMRSQIVDLGKNCDPGGDGKQENLLNVRSQLKNWTS